MEHENDIMFIKGNSIAFGRLKDYQEEGDTFCMGAEMTAGTLPVGPEVIMTILIPYCLDRDNQLTEFSGN